VKPKQLPVKKILPLDNTIPAYVVPSLYVPMPPEYAYKYVPDDAESMLQALQYNIQCALENLLVGRYHNREDRHRIEATIQQVIANAPYPYNQFRVEMSELSPTNPNGLAFRIHPAE
jgi:hypothetical protein